MRNFTQLKTSELCTGMVVNCHGMRCLIDRAVEARPDHHVSRPDDMVRSTDTLVLNREDVSDEAVPYAFTERGGKQHRWRIQGNDLARWSVEAHR